MLTNFIYFQILWFGNILLGNVFVPVSIVVFLIHLKQSIVFKNDLVVMLTCGLAGLFIDSLLLQFGIFEFNYGQVSSELIPPWLVMIWIAFGMTLNHSMHYFQSKPLLAFIAGAFGGPLSYLAGARLGAIEIPFGYLTSFVIFACIWAPLFCLITRWAYSLNQKESWIELRASRMRNGEDDSKNFV